LTDRLIVLDDTARDGASGGIVVAVPAADIPARGV